MKLLLTRHGQTFANEKNLYEGFGDSKLNPIGIRQAQCVAALLKDYNITKTYCSPKLRCIQTLETIKYENKSINEINTKYIEDLTETHFGLWEGKDYKTIASEFPKQWNAFIEDDEFCFPAGESRKDFYTRCCKVVEYIITDASKEDTVLIVSHAGVMRVILCYLLGIGQRGFYTINPKQGAYSSINIYDKAIEIEYINKDN